MTIYEDVKLLLKGNGITINTEDEALFIMQVDGILEDVHDYTNNKFLVDDVVVYPYAIKQYVADVLEYRNRPEVKANLKARSLGSASYTYRDGLPDYITTPLARYRRAKFHVYKPLR